MTAISSSVYTLSAQSGIGLLASTTEAVTTTSFTSASVTYVLNTVNSFTSDARFQVSSQSYLTLIENTYSEVTPDLTCSSSGSTSITYSIADYNGVTAPTWVTIDSNSGLLKMTAPSVSSATSYSFYIYSTISGTAGPAVKLINLQVNK